MIYFLINVLMYLVLIFLLIKYFGKMNVLSFLIVLFNMCVYFIFIYEDINFLYGLLISLVSIILYKLSMFYQKDNQDIILIRDGNINFHELVKSSNYYKLLHYLKIHHIRLDEVAYCLMHHDRITVIRNKEIKGYPVGVIIDGKIMEENLKFIHKNKDWLKEELLKNNLLVKMVNYAYYKNHHIYFVKE